MGVDRRLSAFLAASSMWSFLACGVSLAGETIELGKRHIDPLHGFSLRPPAATERRREFSPTRLVSWLQRDEKTGAVLWSLTVCREVEAKEEFDLEPYSRALADKLRREQNFKVDSIKLAPAAGRQAIHLRGETAGMQLYQRQVWVLIGEGEFLVLKITGATAIGQELDSICDQVLQTLELFDPNEARELERKNLTRGEQFLASLNDQRLAAIIVSEPQWFLLQMNGKDVGFRRETEAAVQRDELAGYEVTIHVMLALPNIEPRLLEHTMFVTGDLKVERWTKRLRIGPPEKARIITEEGLKQHELIVCNVTAEGVTQTHKKELPEGIYLPQAVGMLLPRLADLAAPEGYSFAAYNAEQNNFDMRTFTVVGRKPLEQGGRQIEAISALDRPAATDAPARLYLDAEGRLLRMETEDALVMERSTRSEIVRLFPSAKEIAEPAADQAAVEEPGK